MLTVPRQGGRPLPVEAHLLLKTGTVADFPHLASEAQPLLEG